MEKLNLNADSMLFDALNDFNQKINSLELKIKKLNQLCEEINPYQPLTEDQVLKLKEFNILNPNDPFYVTNSLIKLLEDSIFELHQFKPLNEEELKIENLR